MGWLKRLYDWMLTWADRPGGPIALLVLAFAESSVFPIPPDVLLIALCLSASQRAFWFATLCTLGSTLGGMAGYAIGMFLWAMVSDLFFKYVPGFTPEVFQRVCAQYELYSFWIVFTAAFTPIPYKVITISAGVTRISFLPFVVASVIGRGARFYLVAGLLWKFGPPMKEFIEKYFELLTILVTIIGILGFVALKYLF
ncbi:MAG: lipoprotein B [Candidatus Ozemobacter sibiricus]|jgi:membrane protein YqaA with SNARE-associated domain|uniref:Lipoprotein B n=1 Tax=Candidatus Ozemobacter sibiricus TaxID=2268124 RepID=A0A367ZLF1_9BACT|nr:MAG: lipoprotein B [Candidatus Ozemobacter sibiricus]